MVHGLAIEDGKALWYRNRYVETGFWRNGGGLGAGPPGGASSLSNVSVGPHAGRLLSLGEVGLPFELNPADLSTVGPVDFGGKLTGNFTAHPKVDPSTGDLHGFGYNFTAPYLTYYVVDAAGDLTTAQDVDIPAATMMHDFAITDSDVIFMDLPVAFDMTKAIEMVSTPGSQAVPFEWKPSLGARLGVMPLGGPTSKIRWIDIEPCYVYHTVNAWRQGTDIKLEVCRLDNTFTPPGTPSAATRRIWTIATAGRDLRFSEEILDVPPADLPTMDHRYRGRPSTQSWLGEVVSSSGSLDFTGCQHLNTATGVIDRWIPDRGRTSGEWCFVLSARLPSTQVVSKQICFAADDNADLNYPRFTTDRFLPAAAPGEPYQQAIGVDAQSANGFNGGLVVGNLPSEISVFADPAASQFEIQGTFPAAGDFNFVLQAQNESGTNYRQFEVLVETPQPGNGSAEQCPAGYYFDPNLGYCVQNASVSCPDGTYYDPTDNACIQYPAPPPTVVCGPGYHFDPYISQCVRDGVPRCPLNYHWDSYYERCVRDPYSCPMGYRYDWSIHECVRAYVNECPPGTHFDPYLNRCEANFVHCPPGFFWDPRLNQCVHPVQSCPPGEFWDPAIHGCRPQQIHCGPGYVYDPAAHQCVYQPPVNHCPPGTHYSPEAHSCVPDVHPTPHPTPTWHPTPHPTPTWHPTPTPTPTWHPTPTPTPTWHPTPTPTPTWHPTPTPTPTWHPTPNPTPTWHPTPVPTVHPGPGPGPHPGPGPGPHPGPIHHIDEE
jgi:hypothetical protein